MNKKKKTVLILIIFAIICFIWSNSLQDPSGSYHRSDVFLTYADKILSRILGPENSFVVFFRAHVRKIAHFAEYGLLGTAVGTSMIMFEKLRIRHFYYALSSAVIAAVIDEFIQLYTYRGSSVRDVVIDFSGFTAGLFFSMIIMIACRLLKRTKSNDRMHS